VIPLAGHRGRLITAWLLAMLTCLVLAIVSGCSAKNPYQFGSYDRANYWMETGHYQEAAEAFETYVRQNPTDSLAAQAQYEKARAYMAIKEYPLAAVEFQILAQDYPISPLVEAGMFHEGECYFFQVGRIERDVTAAYEARLHWLDFSRQYPTSEFIPAVQEYMLEIADLLVQKRLRAVKVYRQLKRWNAVAVSLDRILEEEPSSTYIESVLLQRGQVAERLEEYDVAERMYRRVVDEFPDGPDTKTARAGLRRLANLDDEEL